MRAYMGSIMDQLATPARFHATREAMAAAPPALLPPPFTDEHRLGQAERALHQQLPPPGRGAASLCHHPGQG